MAKFAHCRLGRAGLTASVLAPVNSFLLLRICDSPPGGREAEEVGMLVISFPTNDFEAIKTAGTNTGSAGPGLSLGDTITTPFHSTFSYVDRVHTPRD